VGGDERGRAGAAGEAGSPGAGREGEPGTDPLHGGVPGVREGGGLPAEGDTSRTKVLEVPPEAAVV